jgi:hypothetical protein
MTIEGQLREGVFIRMASGTRLGALGIGGPAAFKRQIAQDRVLALWLGDHDRHLGNYLATATGEVRCIDHGMADFAGRVYGENAAGATGDVAELAMTERLKKLRYPGDPKSSYGLWWVDDQITIEDMLPTIRKIQALVARDQKQVVNLLEKTLAGRELEEALAVLRRRAEVLERVIRANFGSIEDLKPIPFSTASLQHRTAPASTAGLSLARQVTGFFDASLRRLHVARPHEVHSREATPHGRDARLAHREAARAGRAGIPGKTDPRLDLQETRALMGRDDQSAQAAPRVASRDVRPRAGGPRPEQAVA